MRPRVPESSSREPHPPSGFERLLAAEVELDEALARAEQEARALLSAADQEVCERAQSLGAAIDAAIAERATRLERELGAERAQIVAATERKVAAWDALTGAALDRFVTHVVARVLARDAPDGRGTS